METSRICPGCGKPTAADAPQGICPECLLKAGAESGSGSGAGAGRAAFAPPSIEAIRKLFPQLEIIGLIGKGGMGAVYKARQPALDRLVALKILPPRSGSDLDFAARFTREARALAKLSHPNIIAVHEFGQVDGWHYFVMEYVDGPNLRQLENAGRLSPRQALQIIPQICEALQFAHDQGIVHRDIKPENVLLDKKGRVRIADFGLAKILDRGPEDLRLTGVTDVVVTPHYMAPEQVEKPQEVDHRADIYSLGVVFYEMLTGELPLGKFAPPSRKAPVDGQWDAVVLRALEKEPALRYQQASEVKTRVETISRGQERGVAVRRLPPPPSLVNLSSIRLVAAIAVSLLVAGGLVALRKILAPGAKPPPAPVAAQATAPVEAGSVAAAGGEEPAAGDLETRLRQALDGTPQQVFERLQATAGAIPPGEAASALQAARGILSDAEQLRLFEMGLVQSDPEKAPAKLKELPADQKGLSAASPQPAAEYLVTLPDLDDPSTRVLPPG